MLSMKELKDKLDDDELDLSMMSLTTVPCKEIGLLKRATKVDLSCNSLDGVPDALCELTHLVKLDLSQNRIAALPEQIGRLVNLQHLDLYKNQLEVLPISMGRLKKLKWLDVKENPLEPVLAKVAGDCLDAKQCQTAATRMVNHMAQVQADLERERQRRLAAEREEEIRRQSEEDRRRMEAKSAKKAEKEKRKSQPKPAGKTQSTNGASHGNGQSEGNGKAKASGKGRSDAPKRGFLMGCVCGLFRLIFNTLFFAAVFVLATAGLLFLNCNSSNGLWVRGTAPLCADLKTWSSKGVPPKAESVHAAANGLRAELGDGAAWLASRDYPALAAQTWETTRSKAGEAAQWIQTKSVPWAKAFYADSGKHASTAAQWTMKRTKEAWEVSKHYAYIGYEQSLRLFELAKVRLDEAMNPKPIKAKTNIPAPPSEKTEKSEKPPKAA